MRKLKYVLKSFSESEIIKSLGNYRLKFIVLEIFFENYFPDKNIVSQNN